MGQIGFVRTIRSNRRERKREGRREKHTVCAKHRRIKSPHALLLFFPPLVATLVFKKIKNDSSTQWYKCQPIQVVSVALDTTAINNSCLGPFPHQWGGEDTSGERGLVLRIEKGILRTTCTVCSTLFFQRAYVAVGMSVSLDTRYNLMPFPA